MSEYVLYQRLYIHSIWPCPLRAWMRRLLSPSIWMLVNPTYIVVLIPCLIDAAFAIKTNVAPTLNDLDWINLHSWVWMMNLSIACWDDLDPSKLILMNPHCGSFHAIQLACLQFLTHRLVIAFFLLLSWQLYWDFIIENHTIFGSKCSVRELQIYSSLLKKYMLHY